MCLYQNMHIILSIYPYPYALSSVSCVNIYGPVFNVTCFSVLFCFVSVFKVRCLIDDFFSLSLFYRLPCITSLCLCTFVYFAIGFCYIPVRLSVCFPHLVGLVTSLVSRARIYPYFITDKLVHVLVYLFCFHISM